MIKKFKNLTFLNYFSGYRCEWCGFTSHGGCRHFVSQECTFGMLQPIYLPPHAVSIPRTEVTMEAIIGVQVKNKGAPMTREYSCRKCQRISQHFISLHFSLFTTLSLIFSIYFLLFLFSQIISFIFGVVKYLSLTFFSVRKQIINTAELRTINLCDSDLSLQCYNSNVHRKFSMSSHSYYSGTESQQSISARSVYDNVDVESESKDKFLESSRFLLPPKIPSKSSAVNRSKSFQETTRIARLRRNLEASSIEDGFIDYSERPIRPLDIENRLSAPPSCSCDKKANGPFYVKFLRRMRKFSLQWRQCKRVPRGR